MAEDLVKGAPRQMEWYPEIVGKWEMPSRS